MSEENLCTRENLNVKRKTDCQKKTLVPEKIECKEKDRVSEENLCTRENLNVKRKTECQKKT